VAEQIQELDDRSVKETIIEDSITLFPMNALAATLDCAGTSDDLPPLWHWLYFLSAAPAVDIGADGHPRRGGLLSPVPLPRRMWAGGRITFHAPLKLGDTATRRSSIAAIEDKTGRSGRLIFVTARHTVEVGGALKIEEEQDIVYRGAPQPGAAAPQPARAPDDESWHNTVIPDAVVLFRYSALTFNGHRIHYDHPYVIREEGYPGLVVHGPLIATLLVDLVRRERKHATLQSFTFKALRPAFADCPLTLCGKPSDDGNTVDLWARDHEGYLTMRATATLS